MTRQSHDTYVALEGARLTRVGQSRRVLCPGCDGGGSHEKSLSITRMPYGFAYQCFRASCEVKGLIGGEAAANGPQVEEDKSYRGTFEPLASYDYAYFHARFGLLYAHGWIGVNAEGKYVMPILDPNGSRRGYVVRHIPWTLSPRIPKLRGRTKVQSFLDSPSAVGQSIYRPLPETGWMGLEGTFVLVEDQISGMKVAQAGLTGIALLGVGLDVAKVREIQRMRPKEVIIALDADASKDAFRLAQDWGLAFPRVRVVLLERDLKDEPAQDILFTLQVKQ